MSRRIAWSACSASSALLAAGAVLFCLNDFKSPSGWGTGGVFLVLCVPTLAFPLVGALIASREPRNAVGWICIAVGISFTLVCLPTEYAIYALETNPGSLPAGDTAAWLANWAYVPGLALLGIFLPLLFPSGRLLSRRWRWVLWVGGLGTLAAAAGAAFLPGPLADSVATATNPYSVKGTEPLNAGFGIMALGFLASAGCVVAKLRRSSGVEREQLKWFAFAAVLLAAVFGIVIVTGAFLGSDVGGLEDLATVCFALLPIATGIAILRHRLYDIDVVINRTLVYGALTATLALTYLGSVLVLQLALHGLTAGSSLAVAASTLAVAGLFRPARARIQDTVDRRFFRRRYDAAQTLEAFSRRLRDEVDLDAIALELRGVVAETMEPVSLSLWLPPPSAR